MSEGLTMEQRRLIAHDAGRNGLIWFVRAVGPSRYHGHVRVTVDVIDAGELRYPDCHWHIPNGRLADRAYVCSSAIKVG
jgi:hypothetical protein